MNRDPVKVFITVDTEAWPLMSGSFTNGFDKDIERDIYGMTDQGEFGIRYQMDVLNQHGLKAIFFVEALFSEVVGSEVLKKIVTEIQEHGHEVQLHVHTEWLNQSSCPLIKGQSYSNIKDFTEDNQVIILRKAQEILTACGASNICAFRAGNYGANWQTLKALSKNGIQFDTSYNYCYLNKECDMQSGELMLNPKTIFGIDEYPISFFEDWPGHYRHTQLTACSFSELENGLNVAWKKGLTSFVLVSHSFELLRNRKNTAKALKPDYVVVKRFELLCRFLSANREKFTTIGFAELPPLASDVSGKHMSAPLRSNLFRTAGRLFEQAYRRFF
jgi:peptidoglycan/xylan/chitin deacetylase (PgdA/CDA1 family)